MNTTTAANQIFDKHPFSTGELMLMLAGALLLAYAILYIILKIRK